MRYSFSSAPKLGIKIAIGVLLCSGLAESTRAQSTRPLPKIRPVSSAPAAVSRQEQDQDRFIGSGQFDETRMEMIQKRLELLKNIVDRDQAATNKPEPPTAPVKPTPKLEFPDNSQDVIPVEPPKDNVEYMTIEAKPIDPIQLGDNLFMDGLHDAAFKSYDSIETRKLKEADVAWAMCMKACCLRHMNQFEKAENTFRSVVRLELAPQKVKEHASWNLEYLQGRIRARKDYDALVDELNGLKKRDNND